MFNIYNSYSKFHHISCFWRKHGQEHDDGCLNYSKVFWGTDLLGDGFNEASTRIKFSLSMVALNLSTSWAVYNWWTDYWTDRFSSEYAGMLHNVPKNHSNSLALTLALVDLNLPADQANFYIHVWRPLPFAILYTCCLSLASQHVTYHNTNSTSI